MKNCLNCRKFSSCDDPNKSGSYSCSGWKRFKEAKDETLTLDDIFKGSSGVSASMNPEDFDGFKKPQNEFDYATKEVNLIKMLDSVFDNNNPWPKDMKIDDGDLPEFANIYEYFFDKNYGLIKSMKPFARQLWIGMMVFGDYCPRCSDKKFISDIQNVPVNMKARDFPDKVQFLKYGVCPKCKSRKSEMVKKGEMNYYRELDACVSGDTRIQTDMGLVRIDSLEKGTILTVSNGYAPDKCTDWFNQGIKPVYLLTTQKGYEIKATLDHKFLSSNGKFLKDVELKDLDVGDYICLSTKGGVYRSVPLNLHLHDCQVTLKTRVSNYKKPETMTGPLASVMGHLLSEGSVSLRRGAAFINSDKKLHAKYIRNFKAVFGVEPSCTVLNKKNSSGAIKGIEFKRTKNSYVSIVCNKRVNDYLLQLGCGLKSKVMRIPECIFSATLEDQLQFVAAYIEGDGSIDADKITVWSASEKLLKDMQVLLSSFGVITTRSHRNLVASGVFSDRLYDLIKPYLVIKQRHKVKERKNNSGFGFPRSLVTQFLNKRRASSYSKRKPVYLNDKGKEVVVFNLGRWSGNANRTNGLFIDYEDLTNGNLVIEQTALKQVSVSRSHKLKDATKREYYFDKVKSIKAVGQQATYDISVKKEHRFFANGIVVHNCIGQRAGKSVSFSFFEGYLLHKYLKMQKPSELLTGLPNVTLSATYTATDFKTANETLWQPFCDIVNESPWYQEYHKMLDFYSHKFGEETYKYMESFLHYKHRKLFLSAASPNKRTLRGRTRFSYAIDELGWFDASVDAKDRVRISADEIYGALDRSMKTVRSAAKNLFGQGYDNIIPGIAFNISSPSSQQDKIMTLVRVHKNSRIVLPVHLATWEYNPKEPKANFTKEYEEDPIKAERDFGANPPMTDSPFFENEEVVRGAFGEKANKVDYEYVQKKKKDKDILLKAARSTPRPQGDIYPSLIAIDAGYSNNSFAMLVMSRKEKDVIVEAAVEVIPQKGKSVLHYPKIFEESINPIAKALNVQFITADRWNSIFLLQKAEEDLKVKWEQYSCKYADFTLMKSFFEGGRIKFPRMEMKPKEILQQSIDSYPNCFDYKPMSHLYLQLLTVSDTGKTVTKGTNKTDDLFRALVLGCHYLLDDEWVKENLKGKMRNTNRGIAALAGGSGASAMTSTGKGIIAVG